MTEKPINPKPDKEILDSIDKACSEILSKEAHVKPNMLRIDLYSKAAEYLIPKEKLEWLRKRTNRNG